jgi:hypothetical protein
VPYLPSEIFTNGCGYATIWVFLHGPAAWEGVGDVKPIVKLIGWFLVLVICVAVMMNPGLAVLLVILCPLVVEVPAIVVLCRKWSRKKAFFIR